MKITFIYAYFVVFLLIINSQKAVLLSERDSYRDAVNSYFLCEAVGYVPGRCSRETFEQYFHPLLSISREIINTFMPALLLLYLFNCNTLKENMKKMKVLKTLRSLSSGRSTSESSTVTKEVRTLSIQSTVV